MYNIKMMLYKEENVVMKQKYIQPDLLMIKLTPAADILAASDEEVFIDGGSLFD